MEMEAFKKVRELEQEYNILKLQAEDCLIALENPTGCLCPDIVANQRNVKERYRAIRFRMDDIEFTNGHVMDALEELETKVCPDSGDPKFSF